MEDLNDLFIFSQVVEHNGFTGAANALGVARSRISRRVAQLEDRLGIRLVQRSTRHFAVTELGKEFHLHCLNMVAEAKAAFEKVAQARAKPSGLIRLSCPVAMAQMLIGPLLPRFVERHPDVRIAVEATNRAIDIDESFDLSLRVLKVPCEDSGMIMKSLGLVQQVLVGSPELIERHGLPHSPEAAARLPSLGYGPFQGPHVWRFVGPDGGEIQVRHEPKLIADDMVMLRQAAIEGVGLAQLPLSVCRSDVERGMIEIVLPDFPAPLYEMQLVFPSRRGMLPAVRSLIDFLGEHCFGEVEPWQIRRHIGHGQRERTHFWTDRPALEPLSRHRPTIVADRHAAVA